MFSSSRHPFLGLMTTALLGIISFLLVIGIVRSPDQTFQSSLQGLSLWWNIVFPSLLPILVLSQILTAYGWIHGIGVFIEPVMRKVFGLPGVSGWALTMGMTVGYPGGAQSTLQLVQQGDITPYEAERMTWLSHFCNPMTIIIVIGIGLLGQPTSGYWLLGIHWIAGFLAFLTTSFISQRAEDTHRISPEHINQRSPLLKRVWSATNNAHLQDGRSLGKLLGESVSHSVSLLMVIGGYIIIMAVMIHLVSSYILPQVPHSYLDGVFELHLGAKALSSSTTITPNLQWALISAMMGWSGLCAILQSISPLRKFGVRWLPFLKMRLLHGVFAFVITMVIWKPMQLVGFKDQPAFMYWPYYETTLSPITRSWSHTLLIIGWQGFILIALVLLSWCIVKTTSRRSP
ncbi:nucleoside recognition domain-containing protein [Paenibacillus sp. CMAA1364]